jgi:hypothetical protein
MIHFTPPHSEDQSLALRSLACLMDRAVSESAGSRLSESRSARLKFSLLER